MRPVIQAEGIDLFGGLILCQRMEDIVADRV